MQELVQICDHIIFNSFAQFEKHKAACAQDGVSVGIRVTRNARHRRVSMQFMTPVPMAHVWA